MTAEDIEEARALLESGDFRSSIEIGLNRVQDSIRQHQEGQELRDRSRSVFAQSESIMEEAIRSVEAAGRAYEVGFAANSTANMEATVRVREMAETLKARLESNQSAFEDVLGLASTMNERAAKDLTSALDSLNSAVMNVARELEESARAALMADSAKDSAMRELLAVQAIWNELASLRQDFLARPDRVLDTVVYVPPRAAEPVDEGRPESGLEEPYVVRQELSADAASLLAPGLSGQAIEDRVLDAAGVRSGEEDGQQSPPPEVESLTGDPALDLEIANAQAAAEFPGTAGASAAEALRREMAGLIDDPDDELPGFPAISPEEDAPAPETPEPVQDAPLREDLTSPRLSRSYTGRVYLMFDASLTQEGLESVWDAVEGAADTGVIVDTRLVSRDQGVQMTLDLDNSRLDVGEFLQRLPGAELAPITADRLKVAWPR